MPDGPTEREIVRGLRMGDRRVWAELCERFGPRVWRHIARLIGGDAEAVADVFQETFLAVARSGRRLDENAKLWGWLTRIAHNQAALHWRKVHRGSRAETHGEPARIRAEGDPFDALDRRETAAIVRGALAEMPADHVALLTAKYLDELSVAEIVERLGGTVESVRSRLARARRDLRERYERMTASRAET
ncbi:MAG: sigma-70 family RNA polymerase sigma factor [Planctomycetaceae bacterium]